MKADHKKSLPVMMFSAIGVVYGDIGTSPLYTLRECLSNQFSIDIERNVLFGFLSLIFWLLILVVSVKYVIFVMNVDNTGEGGILTLMAIARRQASSRVASALIMIGLMGGGFFYGEVIITPAISVMSAIEGLEIIAPQLKSWIIPLSIIILTILFFIQKQGIGFIGKVFAPIMLIWFLVLALLGFNNVTKNLDVLHALNPIWVVRFFSENKTIFFISLGSVVLSITGAEALYANIIHFGKFPVRLAWFIVVLPSLVLNYFGQGALILKYPEAIKNPFFLLAPDWALIPMIIISTLSTVIASQAVISGVFALTRQAIKLGYLFPMKIIHTSEVESGQIYIPFVNWLLYLAVVIVIVNFKHSSNLAAAYGIAVTGTMVLTSLLSVTVAYHSWNWNKLLTIMVLGGFLGIDIPLFFANFDKIPSGGWLSLTFSLVMFIIMITWRSEQLHFLCLMQRYNNSLEEIISSLERLSLVRVSGTAVYISQTLDIIPFSFVLNFKHNKVLHNKVILLTLRNEERPYVRRILNRVKIEKLSSSFWHVIASYGWCETPNIKEIVFFCKSQGLNCQITETSFFIPRISLIMGKRPWYLYLRGTLYLFLKGYVPHALDWFKVSIDQVIELGTKIKI